MCRAAHEGLHPEAREHDLTGAIGTDRGVLTFGQEVDQASCETAENAHGRPFSPRFGLNTMQKHIKSQDFMALT